jgi:serine/threonine-protein kinase RsbW
MPPPVSADPCPGQCLSASYPAVPDSIPRVREELTDFAQSAGATAEKLDAVRLAVSEAATNIVVHAYDGPPGEIRVSARVRQDDFLIEVSDDGLGLRPRIDGRGLGLGLALISQVADGFAIAARQGGGTEVEMRFELGPEDALAEPAGRGIA